MFSIEAGPYYPVTHNQADKGHFTLYGLGERWAVDPGYANEHEPKGRGADFGAQLRACRRQRPGSLGGRLGNKRRDFSV